MEAKKAPLLEVGIIDAEKLLISIKNPIKSTAPTLPFDIGKPLQEKLQPLLYPAIGNGADIDKPFSIIIF